MKITVIGGGGVRSMFRTKSKKAADRRALLYG